ncbi:hypothetical protein H0H87_006369 [Tephrocybe sp. NHM501043]|nr:hypothetical protein H0H87_006369 [Tephrocybe sp. NHM501043]
MTFDPVLRGWSPIHSRSVRVIPVFRKGSPLPGLPRDVLRYIIKLALNKSFGWRRKLLPYGLVCKSWEHVLNLAFGGFEEIRNDYDYPIIIHVARLLNMRPERAAAIHVFKPQIFEFDFEPFGVLSEKWEAILSILAHGTSVKTLHLPFIHPLSVQRYLAVLKDLRQVRTCIMKFPGAAHVEDSNLTMRDVLTAIAGWKQLETLDL